MLRECRYDKWSAEVACTAKFSIDLARMHFPSDMVCSGGWGRFFLVIDDLWESSGGAWTGIYATLSGISSFLFGSPLLHSILDGGNKGWTGQDDWAGWDDGVG